MPRPRSIARYGWRPDLPDPRDRDFLASPRMLAALPSQVDLHGLCPPVYDQGELGSCTATGTGAKTPSKGTVSESTTTNNGNSCSGFAAGTVKTGTTFNIKWAPGSISANSRFRG